MSTTGKEAMYQGFQRRTRAGPGSASGRSSCVLSGLVILVDYHSAAIAFHVALGLAAVAAASYGIARALKRDAEGDWD